jgi:hypothetical protein
VNVLATMILLVAVIGMIVNLVLQRRQSLAARPAGILPAPVAAEANG